MTSNKLVALLLVLAVSCCATPSQLLSSYEAVESHMGTLFRIKLYAEDEGRAQQGFRAAFERIAQLDSVLSDYQPQSELSLITQKAVGRPVAVSDDLFRIAEASQRLSSETSGAFDLTVGPLTRLWRQARRDKKLPQTDTLQSALAVCGFRKLHLETTRHTMEFDVPQMKLDAGGIAKGYAADEALAVLSKLGVHSALIAASGDLAFGEAPPGRQGWKIGVDSYDRADRPFTRVLLLSNAAVSTSGNSEQNLNIAGQTYSHIIDPRTGMGLTEDLTVTTIARRGIIADAAATAISVLGCQKGLAYADGQPDLAVFILAKSNGHAKSLESSRFHDLVRERSFKEIDADDR